MEILRNFSTFYGEGQNLLDFQISLDFATEIVWNCWIFQKMNLEKLEKKLELEENPF